jgi:hypothetical protein
MVSWCVADLRPGLVNQTNQGQPGLVCGFDAVRKNNAQGGVTASEIEAIWIAQCHTPR